MILRLQPLDLFLLFSFLISPQSIYVHADSTFDCHISVNNTKFDLTALAGEHVVNRTRSTPPSTMVDSLRFDICADLTPQAELAEHDQCPSGTRVCLTEVNQKDNEADRVISVIPIAQSSKLDATYSFSLTPKYLSLQLHGPHSNSTTQQSLNLTLFCDPQATSDPGFIAYDGSRLDLEWHAPAGCPFREEGGNKDGDKEGDKGNDEETVGSGIGWFFLVVLLAFIAYFGLGAYYNYSTYGATGLDLIPHRDFWKEVPYMFSDVVSHLCSTVRPRRTSSRGGYISV